MEPPGTAPGSDPFITGAFIAIVRANPNTPNIGGPSSRRKARCEIVRDCPGTPKVDILSVIISPDPQKDRFCPETPVLITLQHQIGTPGMPTVAPL